MRYASSSARSPPASTVPPSARPRSTAARTSSSAASLTTGPTSVAGSDGSPTTPRLDPGEQPRAEVVVDAVLRRRSAASRCTSAPPTRTRRRRQPRRRGRARRRRCTISGFCPPSSSWTRQFRAVASLAHRTADRDRAGERDRADARVRDELGADLRAGAGEHVQHAGGQPGLGEALGDVEAGARRLVAELEHDRVAVDQRGRELPDGDRRREVPRRDQPDDAERAAHGVEALVRHRRLVDLADRAVGLAAGEAEDRGGARRLAARLAQRLAHLGGHVLRDLLGAGLERVGRLEEERGALGRGQPRTSPGTPRRCGHERRARRPASGRGDRRRSPGDGRHGLCFS